MKEFPWPVLGSSVVVAAACFLVLVPCTAYWGTNDDVRMAMLAGGYGIAETPSPGLLHSNVIWGWLAMQLSALAGMTGYAVLSYILIAGTLMALAYALLCARVPVAIALLFLLLPAASVIIYPQFTKSSGLAVVAAIALLLTYRKTGSKVELIAASLLVLTGFWVRNLEAVLVLAVALPFIPWQLVKDRFALICAATLVLMTAVSCLVNWQYYQTDAWQSYLALDAVRVPFTDFGIANLAASQPQAMAAQGYSMADVFLLGNWFFVDREIADPVRMQALLDGMTTRYHDLAGVFSGLSAITNLVYMLPILIASLMVLVMKPAPRVAGAWFGLLFVAAASGYLGRPFPARVLLPLYALLAFVPIILGSWPREKLSHPVVYIVLLVCNLANAGFLWQAQEDLPAETAMLDEVVSYMEEDTAVWGQILFIDNLYRPFRTDYPGIRYYELAEMTHVPNSRATYLEHNGEGFVAQLLSEQGVRLLTRDTFLPLLAAYCAEHHDGQLLRTRQYYRYETRGVKGELNALHCRTH